jgi:hypothetical protein
MNFAVRGFVDSVATNQALRRALPDDVMIWPTAAASSDPPPGKSLLLVIHMSQLPEDDTRRQDHDSCARDCILAWRTGSDAECCRAYTGYVKWVLKHRNRIRVIVGTTGAPSFERPERVAAAREAAVDFPVAFVAPASTLGELLALALQDVSLEDPLEIAQFLEFGKGLDREAAQQLLTAAWVLQLEWEAAGWPSPSKKAELRTLEEKVRAYLLDTTSAETIESDRLASALSEPTAREALDDLRGIRGKDKGWLDWNNRLTEFAKSWLGED